MVARGMASSPFHAEGVSLAATCPCSPLSAVEDMQLRNHKNSSISYGVSHPAVRDFRILNASLSKEAACAAAIVPKLPTSQPATKLSGRPSVPYFYITACRSIRGARL